MSENANDKVQIRIKENGSIRVKGTVEIIDADGKILVKASNKKTVAQSLVELLK